VLVETVHKEMLSLCCAIIETSNCSSRLRIRSAVFKIKGTVMVSLAHVGLKAILVIGDMHRANNVI